ncbi:MAG: hypothetical protein GY765_08250 [bacterium]|nr:hypothetical protein [bacterium]
MPNDTWPRLPYKGLSYYGPKDAALFSGRARDTDTCSKVLGNFQTRILLLHGKTGCGKSSFLRAGLIPIMENEGVGIEFLKKDRADNNAIFIRCTDSPLERLAAELYEFIEKGYTFKRRTKDGEIEVKRDLTEALQGESNQADFIRRALEESFLLESLKILSSILPNTLMVVLDQAEEVITLSPRMKDTEKSRRFFQFLQDFDASGIDMKLVISLRTEYYGRFYNLMHIDFSARSDARQYYLDDFSLESLEEAIERPTSKEPVPGFGVPPYGFEYEPGLVKKIASQLMEAKQQGGVLPVMQIVCSGLYGKMRRARKQPQIITHDDYKNLGGITGRIQEHIKYVLQDTCKKQKLEATEIENEIHRWMHVLVKFSGMQGDGTVTTEVIAEEKLAGMLEEAGVKLNIPVTLEHLANPRKLILKSVELFNSATGKRIPSYSLGHDVIGLTLKEWFTRYEEEVLRKDAEKGKETVEAISRWYKLGLIVSLIGFVAAIFFSSQQLWTSKVKEETRTLTEVNRIVKQAKSIKNKNYSLALLLAIEVSRRLDDAGLESEEEDPRQVIIDILSSLPHKDIEIAPSGDMRQIFDQKIAFDTSHCGILLDLEVDGYTRFEPPASLLGRFGLFSSWFRSDDLRPNFINYFDRRIQIKLNGKKKIYDFEDLVDTFIRGEKSWQNKVAHHIDLIEHEIRTRGPSAKKLTFGYQTIGNNYIELFYNFQRVRHSLYFEYRSQSDPPFAYITKEQRSINDAFAAGYESLICSYRFDPHSLLLNVTDLKNIAQRYLITLHVRVIPKSYLYVTFAPDDSAFGFHLDKQFHVFKKGEKKPLLKTPMISDADRFCVGSAKENLIVAVYRDRGIDFYDSAGKSLLSTPLILPASPRQISFSGENKYFLANCGMDVYAWDLKKIRGKYRKFLENMDNKALRKKACEAAGRDMTDDEWALYFGGKREDGVCKQYNNKKQSEEVSDEQ